MAQAKKRTISTQLYGFSRILPTVCQSFFENREVYMAHPRVTKIWKGMKVDIVIYVVRCLECHQVKAKHRHPTGLQQPHVILESKWKIISMDFIVGFSLTARGIDLIFMVVDTMMKSAHFIPVPTVY
jgi:hypothetical protein